MRREFIQASGKPENKRDKAFRAQVEAAARKNAPESQAPSAELYRPCLEAFPYEWLNGVFRYIHDRSRVPTEFRDLIQGTEGVQLKELETEMGSYAQMINVVKLDPTRMENKIPAAVELGLDAAFTRQLLLTRVLIHEAVHAYSKTLCSGVELFRKQKEGTFVVESGLEKRTFVKSGADGEVVLQSAGGRALNEGLVDILADDIFREYLSMQGLTNSAETSKFLAFYEQRADPYREYRIDVAEIADSIAADRGVDMRTVIQAFIQQLSAEGPLSEELKAWIEELGANVFFKGKESSSTAS
ncbi:hypothetical protein COU19_00870 [Candidatus Kaiserbacteria bacterium CG10_big_fil_rev_8_21_14_0_10_56_12]|uniref:Uncharacterized protein n=1 Tax=Candidatus Kaiserbacteria bacterium CG10_big_fil_rev_8_21_14_0_10_56_12 TaxID=1974611 RepID=A0A2H0UAA9_9BACT|nr:MAG: hypothetical protein COU19_00870 [Candidatus Kaiserbacteria bacterium CG10_big_fil_rev_8_21_14_0_10_56_12]